MSMSDKEILPVVQGNLEAAADYVKIAFGNRYRASVLNEGRWPDLVQAFARHRERTIEECARVAELAGTGCEITTRDENGWPTTTEGAAKHTSVYIATAIRSLASPPSVEDESCR